MTVNKECLARIRQHLPQPVRRLIVEFRYRFLKKTAYGEELFRWKKFRVYHRRYDQDVNDPVLYLTLDVEKGETPSLLQILDILKEKRVCAGLFLIGEELDELAPLLPRIIEDGHFVANHTTTHPELTECSRQQVRQELTFCHQKYRELTGQEMARVMRPPYGLIHRPLAKQLYRMGYTVMHWSLHVMDYKKENQPGWEVFRKYYQEKLHNGGIILQHTYSPGTAASLGKLIDLCRAEGYRFAGIEEFQTFENRPPC